MPENTSDTRARSVQDKPTGLPEWVISAIGAAIRLLLIVIPYVMGRAYIGGWWKSLGLGDGLDRYSFDDYVFYGFFALVGGTTDFMSDGLALRLLKVGLGVTGLFTTYIAVDRGMDWLVRRMRSVRQREKARDRVEEFMKRWSRLAWLRGPLTFGFLTLPLTAMWATLVVLALIPVALAERAGWNEGQRLRERINVTDTSRYPIATLSAKLGVTSTARLLQCSTDWCVVYVDRNFHALPKADVQHVGLTALPVSKAPAAAKAAVAGSSPTVATPPAR